VDPEPERRVARLRVRRCMDGLFLDSGPATTGFGAIDSGFGPL
jgi:hypothetical protein